MQSLTKRQLQNHESKQLRLDKNYDPAGDPVVRASGIGGSEMATILGIDTYKAPVRLCLEKRGEWPEQFVDDVGSKLPVRIGRLVEDDICDMLAEDEGLKLERYRKTPRHKSLTWPMAHPDRRVVGKWKGHKAIVEAKWSSRVGDWGEPGTDQIPEYYLPQVHQEMWLTGADVCLVPVWLFQFRVTPAFYVVWRDQDWDQILESNGSLFWSHVINGTDPAVDFNSAAAQDAIRKIYRENFETDSFIALGEIGQRVTDNIAMHKDDVKVSQGGVDADTAIITKMMGKAQFGMLPDGRWWRRKKNERAEFTVEATSYVDQRVVKNLPKGVTPPAELTTQLYSARRAALQDAHEKEMNAVMSDAIAREAADASPALTIIDNRESK